MSASSDPATPTHRVDPATRRAGRVKNRWWYLLLLPPFVGLLWVPWYAKEGPELWGFPFFYWYQFLWVLIGVVLTAVTYVLTTESDEPPPYPNGAHERSDAPSEGVR